VETPVDPALDGELIDGSANLGPALLDLIAKFLHSAVDAFADSWPGSLVFGVLLGRERHGEAAGNDHG
jgi:hypothetical protein